MRFVETGLEGAFVVELDRHEDERGWFARTFDADEFRERGLNADVVQTSISRNHARGTLRGMHWQAPPAAEAKLVRATRGAVHDVIVDLRADSATYLEHFAVVLDAQAGTALYVPELFAHGFQALEDDTDVAYQISERFAPEHARGARHDDSAFCIG